MRRFSLLRWALALLTAGPALAQTAPPPSAPLDVAAVDAVVARALKAFDVPGVSVAVVKDGQVVAKGYGVRSLKTKAPMDANTLVGIASNTKALTTAALVLAAAWQQGALAQKAAPKKPTTAPTWAATTTPGWAM